MIGPRKIRADDRVDWRESMNSHRAGASYFQELVNVLFACPSGYFEHRRMTTESKEAIIHEWEEWMVEFSKRKKHSPDIFLSGLDRPRQGHTGRDDNNNALSTNHTPIPALRRVIHSIESGTMVATCTKRGTDPVLCSLL